LGIGAPDKLIITFAGTCQQETEKKQQIERWEEL